MREKRKRRQGAHHRVRLALVVVAVLAIVAMLAFWAGSILMGQLFPLQVTAHRGGGLGRVPENTLPAFAWAVAEGVDYAELDVQETADGVVVLTHDVSLARCTGVDAPVYDLTYAELCRLDAAHYMPGYPVTPIPTLEQVLLFAKETGLKLNIEMKANGRDNETLAEKTAALIRATGMEKNCVVCSFSYQLLQNFKAVEQDVPAGFLINSRRDDLEDLLAADFFSVQQNRVTADLVSRAHALDKEVWVWTVNSMYQLRVLLYYGVDNVITDYPARAWYAQSLALPDWQRSLADWLKKDFKT